MVYYGTEQRDWYCSGRSAYFGASAQFTLCNWTLRGDDNISVVFAVGMPQM